MLTRLEHYCPAKLDCEQEFFEAGGSGTRQAVIEDTGHQQFLDAGWAFNKGFDWLCKCGSKSRAVCFLVCFHPLIGLQKSDAFLVCKK